MSKAVDLREDLDADTLRRLARKSRDAGQSRRLLALAAIYEGGSRTQASRIGAVGLPTVRDWVLAFNAAGPDGLIERKKPGPRFKLDAAQRQALAAVIEEGPDLQRDGVVRWRLKDLAAWLFARFGVSFDESSVGPQERLAQLRPCVTRDLPRRDAAGPKHAAASCPIARLGPRRGPRVRRTRRRAVRDPSPPRRLLESPHRLRWGRRCGLIPPSACPTVPWSVEGAGVPPFRLSLTEPCPAQRRADSRASSSRSRC